MYYLFKIRRNENNNSVLGHPLNVILKSKDMEEIKEKIKSMVIVHGNPEKDFFIFKEIPFGICANIIIDAEQEEGNMNENT